ncbi:hypothetical protein PG999_013783 [Apiospora kogelbergensis]|uniref:Extracellular serine-rich protein n=1 Tax=Apiospora kogelbergensis TaxID=1337665 RepID=A0AAW0Q555_9PEZI
MRLFLGVLALAVGVHMSLAHDAATPDQQSPPATQTTATPAIHTISVGAAGFSFRPDSVTANVGDIVRFNFYPTNHSVARAEFRYPCIPYETVEIGRRGFYSDLVPVQAILNEPPHFDVKINDTEPIFFYCTVPGSCLQNSMVGVINPNGTFTLDIQKQYVQNSTFEFAPGQPFPTEMPRPDPKVPGGYMPPAANNATTAGAHVGGGHDSSMSGPVVAGIAVGSVALLGLIAGLLFLYYRKRRQGQGARGQQRRKGGGGHIALRSAPSPAASSSPFLSTTAMPPPRPPRSPKRQRHSEGLLFACQGEREQQPSSRSGTPRDGGLCMSPTAQEHDKAVLAYSSPEAPYYGIISPMREKPDYYQHHHHHQNQQPQHGSAYSISNNQYHPSAPIVLASTTTPQTPAAPAELPASADPGNSPLPRYYNNWSRPFSWRRGVDYNYRPDKVGGNMI